MREENPLQRPDTGDLVKLNGVSGKIWKVLPPYTGLFFEKRLIRPATGRELGGLRLEQVEPPPSIFQRQPLHVSASQVRVVVKKLQSGGSA